MYRGIGVAALAAVATLFGACGGDDGVPAQSADAAADTGPAAAAGSSPAFALVRGEDTLLVESYTLSGDRVSGTLRDPGGSTVDYEASHGRDGAESTMRLTLDPASPQDGPAILSTFTIRGDSAWLETSRGDSTLRHGDTIEEGALPYLSPSIGMMALVAQSARATVGDSGQVTLLAASLGQPPMVVSPVVFWRADTAFITANEANRFRLVFSNGQLVSAENPPLGLRTVPLGPDARP